MLAASRPSSPGHDKTPPTLFLASVRDAGEAETAMTAGADIIDLKDPQSGALGALDLKTIASCVRSIARRAPVSATVGDLPLDGETIRDAVLATAASGVDYVKLGLFPGGDARACLRLLEAERSRVHLILVLFADALPDFDAVGEAARIGAAGVMLDTAGKSGGSLLDHLSLDTLARFVAAAKGEGLTVGLAGSLKANHVPQLLGLGPDLLGFRSALCRGRVRAQPLDPLACTAIRALIPQPRRALPKADLLPEADLLPQADLADLAPQALY